MMFKGSEQGRDEKHHRSYVAHLRTLGGESPRELIFSGRGGIGRVRVRGVERAGGL
jgi:hypothetical protein